VRRDRDRKKGEEGRSPSVWGKKEREREERGISAKAETIP
jgi:hypothetical protein